MADLVTMTDAEYEASLRDERPDEWRDMTDSTRTPRTISAERWAELAAMGFRPLDETPF